MLQTMAHVIHLSLLQLGMFIVITVTCNLKDYLKGHRLDLAMQIHFNTFIYFFMFFILFTNALNKQMYPYIIKQRCF